MNDLKAEARAWAEDDPDEVTRSEILSAIRQSDEKALRAAFEHPLKFGTAGLRGPVGPGAARMNLLLAARFGWGLGDVLRRRDLVERGVVVGYDARRDSKRFAQCIADVLAGIGARVWLGRQALPTPLVAYSVLHLNAGAGVVVTASHNPREDNGIKVYDDEGVQIVAPWDTEIAGALGRAPRYVQMARHPSAVRMLPESALAAYFEQLSAQVTWGSEPSMRVAYTPLHGVGFEFVSRAFEGTPVALHPVREQSAPDGTFPTVRFPNPEEPGVLDLLVAKARSADCEIALANDPDADRLAVALPFDGTWEMLSGDDVGLLLADAIVSEHSKASTSCVSCVSSIVSSPGLEALVERHGARVLRTLTGFKWLCRAALSDPACVFGYEEALGYFFRGRKDNPAPLDKDGIAGALHLCALLHREGTGRALLDRLERIYRRMGLWVSVGVSVRFPDRFAEQGARDAMTVLRNEPPRQLQGAIITDYLQGAEKRPFYLGAQDLLCFDVEGDMRVLVRPSGTEPKLKLYLHLRRVLEPSDDFVQTRASLIQSARDWGKRLSATLLDSIS